MRLRVIGRLLQIQRVLVRHGLDDFVLATHLFRPLQFVFFLSPALGSSAGAAAPAANACVLRSRSWADLRQVWSGGLDTPRPVTADIADELAKLQDRVPRSPARTRGDRARLGRPSARCSPRSTNAARRRLDRAGPRGPARTGDEAVVKVLRPGMRAQIGRDLEVLYTLAGLAARLRERRPPLAPRSSASTRRPSWTSST